MWAHWHKLGLRFPAGPAAYSGVGGGRDGVDINTEKNASKHTNVLNKEKMQLYPVLILQFTDRQIQM